MAERRWEIPADVAREARRLAASATGVDAARLSDIASLMPVGRSTLLALLAAGVNGRVGAWATQRYMQAVDTESDADIRVLTAAAVDDTTGDVCYGLISDDAGVDVITDVAKTTGDGLRRWTGDDWQPVPDGMDPVGLRFRELRGDTLTAALAAINDGHGLVLRAGTPKAFLPRRIPLTASAGGVDGVYAAVDEVDTTAVFTVARVNGGTVHARMDGEWVPDPMLMPHLLASGVPLALLPDGDVAPTLRQVDDHDAVFPVLAAASDGIPIDTADPPDSLPDFTDGVMVALPVDNDTAQQLAVPGGVDPAGMHVTLAYLGSQDDCPVNLDVLCELVQQWAHDQTPFTGEVSGPGTFQGTRNADNPVHVALVDAPGLSEARGTLVDHLTGNGVPVNTDHGYTPHVSRAYGPDDIPTDGVGGTPLSFDQVGVWHGPDRQMIPLAGVTAAFNPAEARDPGGKWTAGGGSAQNKALEANRKTSAPHAAPAGKTVVAKPYHPPKGGGGAGKKAAAAKKVAAKKAALRQTTATREKTERDTEAAAVRSYQQSTADANVTEQQRRAAFAADYARLPKTAQAAAWKKEQATRAAWTQTQATARAAEQSRHADAMQRIAADKKRLDAQLAKDVAAVKASSVPVIADAAAHTRTPRQLEDYWVRGPGAAKIAWTAPGDYNRCLAELGKYVHDSHQVHGQCASLHKIATGIWPATHAKLERGGGKR